MKKRFVVKAIASAVLAAALAVAPLVESATNINLLSVSASAATTCRRVTLSRSEYNSIKSHWDNKGVSYLGYDLRPQYAKKLAIIDMQNLLNKVMGAGLTVDGQYGSKSQAAVKQFQRMVGISADGLFGNTSFTKLMSYIDVSGTVSSASVPSFDGKKLQICSAFNKNLVFDLEGGNSPQNETNICAYENHGGNNQIFLAKKEYTDSSGKEWYKLYPSNDTTGKYALNVNYGGNYNNLQTYASSGLYTNELFSFESDGTGTYHIAALCGGYIEVAGNYNVANVYRREGYKLANSKNQQFYLSEVNSSASGQRYNANSVMAQAKADVGNFNGRKYFNEAWCSDYVSKLITEKGGISSSLKSNNCGYLTGNITKNNAGTFYCFNNSVYNAIVNSANRGGYYNFNRASLNNTKKASRNSITPQAGDIILFSWDGDTVFDHVGFVNYTSGNTVYTIEGNTSFNNTVNSNYVNSGSRSYNSASIIGIIRMK